MASLDGTANKNMKLAPLFACQSSHEVLSRQYILSDSILNCNSPDYFSMILQCYTERSVSWGRGKNNASCFKAHMTESFGFHKLTRVTSPLTQSWRSVTIPMQATYLF